MKAQLTIDYYAALIIFVLFIAYLFLQTTSVFPSYFRELGSQRLSIEAYQISELLINDPGKPVNWETLVSDPSKIERIGLANGSTTKMNSISSPKALALQSLCNSPNGFETVKSKISSEFDFSIIVLNRVSGELFDCSPASIGRVTEANTTFDRIVTFGNGYGELILQMWS